MTWNIKPHLMLNKANFKNLLPLQHRKERAFCFYIQSWEMFEKTIASHNLVAYLLPIHPVASLELITIVSFFP